MATTTATTTTTTATTPSSSKPREYFTLNTGAKIPAIGFGTWKAPAGQAGRAVEEALRCGYRHFVSPKSPDKQDCGGWADFGRVGLCATV